jgi:DNA-directed RNA polymerase subunit beta'
MREDRKIRKIAVLNKEEMEEREYAIPYGYRIRVAEGDTIEAGDMLTEGSVYPHDILDIKGALAVQDYLIAEVQRVYRLQGVDINDKHIEVIVRQMMKKVRVDNAGSTTLLAGSMVDKSELYRENDAVQARIDAGEEGLEKATFIPELLGITKASLATDSFLSAASFQETTKVLTDAAIKGKEDPLLGLKENVIIGNLIPAGTGMSIYTDMDIKKTHAETIVE